MERRGGQGGEQRGRTKGSDVLNSQVKAAAREDLEPPFFVSLTGSEMFPR